MVWPARPSKIMPRTSRRDREKDSPRQRIMINNTRLARAKRKALKASGEKLSRASFMTVKLTPQISAADSISKSVLLKRALARVAEVASNGGDSAGTGDAVRESGLVTAHAPHGASLGGRRPGGPAVETAA